MSREGWHWGEAGEASPSKRMTAAAAAAAPATMPYRGAKAVDAGGERLHAVCHSAACGRSPGSG
jgi:hypothetical protein